MQSRLVMGMVLLILFALVLMVEGPLLIAILPRRVLFVLCFLPAGAIGALGLYAFLHHSTAGWVMALPLLVLNVYGAFALRDMVDARR